MKLINRHEQSGGESHHYFLDLAANDAVHLSNTLHLEQNGWKGLCIEGNPMYWYSLSAFRNCTIVGAFVFVGGTEDGKQVGVRLSNKFLVVVSLAKVWIINRARKSEEEFSQYFYCLR